MKTAIAIGQGRAAATGASCAAALLLLTGFRLLPESTPVARGTANAYMHNCIDCHGQPAQGQQSRPDDAALECTAFRTDPTHPRYEGVCPDLLAYFEVVRLKRTFESRASTANPNRLLQGEQLARKYSCFHCHGQLGQGGFRNAGALKGYIPGYFGNDFASLTRGGDKESIRAWIRQGVDAVLFDSFIRGPVAEFFIERQTVGMPSYGTLPETEIVILVEYVTALNQIGEMSADEIRAYRRRTERQSALNLEGAVH